jgi:hypothetical protein
MAYASYQKSSPCHNREYSRSFLLPWPKQHASHNSVKSCAGAAGAAAAARRWTPRAQAVLLGTGLDF